MELNLERPRDYLFVRKAGAREVVIVDRALTASFILARQRVFESWSVTDVTALSEASIAPILALQPEVVLLGTGARQRFPAQQILAAFLQRGIGIEVMDNAAVGRTWDILASEGREVVAAFILEAR